MEKLLLGILLSCSLLNSHAQSLQWAKQIGGADQDRANSTVVDNQGNVYSCGYFELTVDFDPGPGVFNMTADDNQDIFISKLDNAGNFLWAKQMGGTSNEEGKSLALDASGNLYVSGWFNLTVDFDPGPGTHELTAPNNDEDVFIAKFSPSGDFIWVKQIGGTGEERVNGLTVDNLGNVYSTGSFQYTVDFDPGPGVYNIGASGNKAMFISKLDSLGNFVWAKKINGSGAVLGLAIDVDLSGNVHTTGVFKGTADFNPGSGFYGLTTGIYFTTFVSKLDGNGDFLWAAQMESDDTGFSNDIVVNASGEIYTTGLFEDTTDFDPGVGVLNLFPSGSKDIFICKLDASGNLIWVKQMGGFDGGIGTSIDLDQYGNVYSAGTFTFTIDFDPGADTSSLASLSEQDAYILKLDSDGNFIAVRHIRGWGNVRILSIFVDSFENIYTCGHFSDQTDFDPGIGSFYMNDFGFNDAFIHKMDLANVSTPELYSKNEILVYPNPNNGQLNVNLGAKLNMVNITLTDLAGKTILKQTLSDTQFLKLELDRPSGIYLLSIEAENEKSVFRIVKK